MGRNERLGGRGTRAMIARFRCVETGRVFRVRFRISSVDRSVRVRPTAVPRVFPRSSVRSFLLLSTHPRIGSKIHPPGRVVGRYGSSQSSFVPIVPFVWKPDRRPRGSPRRAGDGRRSDGSTDRRTATRRRDAMRYDTIFPRGRPIIHRSDRSIAPGPASWVFRGYAMRIEILVES